MILHFYLRYSTKFGQSLYVTGNTVLLGNDDVSRPFALTYLNDQLWHGSIEITGDELEEPLCYKYILEDEKGERTQEYGNDRIIVLGKTKASRIVVSDEWNYAGAFENAFYTAPFADILLKRKVSIKNTAHKIAGEPTHELRVKAPVLQENEVICISGSSNALHDWDKKNVLLLTKKDNWWVIQLDLSKVSFPVGYKYGIYNIQKEEFTRFEEGNNRIILNDDGKDAFTIIHDGFTKLNNVNWKGAGVAIPVFSLRTKKSFGTGEFNDLKLLVDWAKKTGLKMIQLLPVNDTTATYSWKDSYPYSAISAFALHPLLINLETVAGTANAEVVNQFSAKKKKLNKLAELDYEEVMKIKITAIKELYKLQKEHFKDNLQYITFFELNRHWLEPYAAFNCRCK